MDIRESPRRLLPFDAASAYLPRGFVDVQEGPFKHSVTFDYRNSRLALFLFFVSTRDVFIV